MQNWFAFKPAIQIAQLYVYVWHAKRPVAIQ